MALTTDEVKKIAILARLRLTPEEEELFTGQLGKIVDYIGQLDRYPIGSPASPVSATPVLEHERADGVSPCLPREVFLANAPASEDGFLLVPEVKGNDDAG